MGLTKATTAAEKERLRAFVRAAYGGRYSEAQLAAIEAGESSIETDDLLNQAAAREDPWQISYPGISVPEDFSHIDPVVDKPVKAPYSNFDPNQRMKEDEELEDDFAKFIQDMPEEPEAIDWLKFHDNLRLTVGKEEAERNARSFEAPELFQPGESFLGMGDKAKPFRKQLKDDRKDKKDDDEVTPALLRLMQMTGYDRKQIQSLRVKSIISHFVVNQTRLGKIRKMYILSIAGNGLGLLGIGEGKSDEPGEAKIQSQYRAIRNMQPVLRYENRTIYGDVKGKVGATELQLYTRPPGMLPLAHPPMLNELMLIS